MESARQKSGCFWKTVVTASRNIRFSMMRKSFVSFVSEMVFVSSIVSYPIRSVSRNCAELRREGLSFERVSTLQLIPSAGIVSAS
jgi:hypothetical protein